MSEKPPSDDEWDLAGVFWRVGQDFKKQQQEALFEFLRAEHDEIMATLDACMNDVSDETEENDEVENDTASLIATTQNFFETVKELTTRGIMASHDIVYLFKNDDYVGSDLRDVVHVPNKAPGIYPNRTGFTAAVFIKAVANYLPSDIWLDNNGLKQIKSHFNYMDQLTYNQREADIISTPLLQYIDQQQLAQMLSVVKTALYKAGQRNLYAVADAFRLRAETSAQDILQQASKRMIASQFSFLPDNDNDLDGYKPK